MAEFTIKATPSGDGYKIYKQTARGLRPVGATHASKSEANAAAKRLGSPARAAKGDSVKGGMNFSADRAANRSAEAAAASKAQTRARSMGRVVRKAGKIGRLGRSALGPGGPVIGAISDATPTNVGEQKNLDKLKGKSRSEQMKIAGVLPPGSTTPRSKPKSSTSTSVSVGSPATAATSASRAVSRSNSTPRPKPADRPSAPKPRAKPADRPSAPRPQAKPSAGGSSFRQAFASARSAGKKEFEWNGKRYTTKVKK